MGAVDRHRHGLLGEPNVRETGRLRLQRAFRLHLLSPAFFFNQFGQHSTELRSYPGNIAKTLSGENRMRNLAVLFRFFVLVSCATWITSALATDAFHGKVVAVKKANLVTFETGSIKFELQLAGIEVSKQPELADKAINLVDKLVLDKSAYIRVGSRTKTGRILVRLLTEDPEVGAYDVAVELVRAGLARRQKGFDFKYGELAAAEEEAKKAKRGIWSGSPPREKGASHAQ